MARDYTLLYWPIPFRGHIPRYVLAHAGADWDEPGDFAAMAALKDAPVDAQPTPFMGPPVLIDHRAGGRALAQMPAICLALGRAHGLSRDPDLEARLLCDASDVLVEITCQHGHMMWTPRTWATFRASRLPRWLAMHERLAVEAGVRPGAGFFGGAKIALSDLALAGLWFTMAERLPPLRPDLERHAPTLAGLVDRVAATARIAALRAAWEDCPHRYCGGQIEANLLAMLAQDTAP